MTLKSKVIVFLSSILFCSSVLAGVRIQQANLTYLGSSALPVPTGNCGSAPSENDYAPGLAYNPAGNGGAGSFYLSGARNSACLAEIAVPVVGSTPALLQSWQYDPWSGAHYQLTPASVCSEGCFIGGLGVYNNTLYANVFSYYSNGVTSAQFTHNLTLSNTTGRTGPNVIGNSTAFQDQLNGWITRIPAEHQTKLGGEWVMGNGFNSVISRTSFGPALAVMTPGSTAAPVWLMRYDGSDSTRHMIWAGNAEFPPCPGAGNRCTWDTQDSGQPLANGTTKVGGVTFIEGSDTVAFIISSGTGPVCYKTSCTASNMDPGCSAASAGGHSAAPTKYILEFFDVDDLAAAKNGTINPWDVTPYSVFSISTWSNWASSCAAEWHTLGIHFLRDSPTSSTGKLYIYRARNNAGNMHTPTMHIYSVSGLDTGSGDTTAPAVSITAPTAGATVSGTSTSITATCTDNVGVSSVQFKVDGSNVGSPDTSSPYSIVWDTTSVSNGSHSLTATCTDTSSNATTSSAVSVTVSNAAGIRIQSTNLNYIGTANITQNEGACGGGNNEKAPGLALNPAGNGGAGSLFIAGRRNVNCVAEITKPNVGETATYIQTFVNPVDTAIDSIDTGGDCGNGCWIGGLLVQSSRLFLTSFVFYDSNDPRQNSTLFNHNLTLSNNGDRTGPLVVGAGYPTVIQRMQYMTPIPSNHQAKFGGRTAMVGGCCMNIISQSSYGPALWAFTPTSPTNAVSVLGYPEGHATLRPWGEQPPHPEFNPVTKITAVTFIDGSDTVLFIGHTGTGTEYCYGYSTLTQALHGTNAGQGDGLPWCYDPNMAAGQLGTHIYPKSHYAWAYDVDDLALAFNGTINPWDVMPYATWELPDLGVVAAQSDWFPDNSVTGVVFDVTTNRLYVSKGRKVTDAAPYYSQLHIYSVSGLGGTLAAPQNYRYRGVQ